MPVPRQATTRSSVSRRLNWKLPDEQYRRQFLRRDLEAYWLYKFTPRYQLRVTANNILGEDSHEYQRYVTAAGTEENQSRRPESARISANLELKF